MAYPDIIGHGSRNTRYVLIVYCEHEQGTYGAELRLTGSPRDGDKVMVMGRVYTFRTILSSPAVPNEVKISISPRQCLLNLFNALKGASSTNVSSGTTANTQVVAGYNAALMAGIPAGTLAIVNPVLGAALDIDTSDIDDLLEPYTVQRLDTAQLFHDRSSQYLGGDFDSWRERDYETPSGSPLPPLQAATEMMHAGMHTMKPIFIGVDEQGVVNPYIIPGDVPYGFYRAMVPKANAYGANDPGWDYWGSALYGFVVDNVHGSSRRNSLSREILTSEYLRSWLPPGLQLDNNMEEKIDLVLVNTPCAYAESIFAAEGRNFAINGSLVTPIELNGRPIRAFLLDGGGIEVLSTTLHEYYHFAYSIGKPNPIIMDGCVVPSPISDDKIHISSSIFDVYLDRHPPDSTAAPWGNFPCEPCTHFAFRSRTVQGDVHSAWCKTVLPQMGASLGFTKLDRIVTESGIYQIQNFMNDGDCIVIQSPNGMGQFMMLTVYYPVEMGGSLDYPYSGGEWKGVYATIWEFDYMPHTGSPNGTVGYDTLLNRRAFTFMNWVCTEKYGYTDIDNREYCYTANDVEKANPILNPAPVLLEDGKPNPKNTPFGVTVKFLGWLFPDGIPTAEVEIEVAEYPELPTIPATNILALADDRAKIGWTFEPGHHYGYQLDRSPSFDSPDMRRVVTISGEYTFRDLLASTNYYFRVRHAEGKQSFPFSEWSNVLKFTTPGADWHLLRDEGALLVGALDLPGDVDKVFIEAKYKNGVSITHDVGDPWVGLRQISVPVVYSNQVLELEAKYVKGWDVFTPASVFVDVGNIGTTIIEGSGRYPIPFNTQLRWVDEQGRLTLVCYDALAGMRTYKIESGVCYECDEPGCFIEFKKIMALPAPTGECRICFKDK